MSLKKELEKELLQSMRSRDEVRRNALRMVISSIKMAEVESGSELDDTSVYAIFQKEIKTREETIAEAETDVAEDDRTPEQPAEPRPSLSDDEREQFITDMRELGVSVERDDDGHIISLVMGFTEVDDEKLAALPALPHLEFIGLDHTNITDMGLKALSGRTSLQAIQLGGNKITAAGY